MFYPLAQGRFPSRNKENYPQSFFYFVEKLVYSVATPMGISQVSRVVLSLPGSDKPINPSSVIADQRKVKKMILSPYCQINKIVDVKL